MATMTCSRPVTQASWRPQRLVPAAPCRAALHPCPWTPPTAAPHPAAAVNHKQCSTPPVRALHRHSSSSRRAMRLHSTALWVPPVAMVNVDFASPSLVLGTALIACGIALLQARNLQRRVSRDADIVVAAMISIVGSTLIFQGWRLDPLLLLCQALTTSVALWYGLETFKLRSELEKQEEDQPPAALPPPQDMMYRPGGPEDYGSSRGSMAPTSRGYLPPGRMAAAPWEAAQQQQQQQQGELAGSSRWGRPYEEVSRGYDVYSRPAGPYSDPLPAGMDGPSTSSSSGGGQPGALPPFLPGGPPQGEGYGGAPPGAGYPEAAGPSGVPGQLGTGYGPWYGPQGQEYGPPGAGGGPYGAPADYQQQQQQQYPQQQQGPGGYGQPPYDPAAAGGAPAAPGRPQQQQQQPAGARPRDYERIDDWE